MVANVASVLVVFVVAALVFRRENLDSLAGDPYRGPNFSGGFVALQLLSLPLNAVVLAYLGSLIAWLYQAGKFAESRGWPATRGRTLGAFSVLIPVVGIWWPYEALRDAYPPGARPAILLKWWVSYLVTSVVTAPVFFVTLFAPAAVVVIAIAIAAGVLAIPIVLGWKVIRDVEAMQRANSPAP